MNARLVMNSVRPVVSKAMITSLRRNDCEFKGRKSCRGCELGCVIGMPGSSGRGGTTPAGSSAERRSECHHGLKKTGRKGQLKKGVNHAEGSVSLRFARQVPPVIHQY